MSDKYRDFPEEIREIAQMFDDAIVEQDEGLILSSFSDDCEIELLNLTLYGKEGVKRWIDWFYRYVDEVEFVPVTIMVKGNTFFEEFIVSGRFENGKPFRSKQAEVLEFKDKKISSLRLYFDRLDFADALVHNIAQRTIVKKIISKSQEGLLEK